MALKRAKVDR